MRTSRVLPALLTLLLPACSDPLTTGAHRPADGVELDAARGAAVTRNIGGTCTTTFPPAPLPLPPVLEQTDIGVCNVSHLGRSEYLTVKEIHFATGTQITTEFRLTAANGDILRGTGIGSNSPAGPGLVGFDAVMTVTGGTGRFAGASGSLDVSGIANLATSSASLTIGGRIRY